MHGFKPKSSVVIALSAVAVAMAAATAVHSVRRPALQPVADSAPAPVQASAGNDATPVIRFVKDPEPAPPFRAKDLNGKTISDVDWKGKVVIVNFWATWCGPCRIEIPILESLQEKYKDRLEIIGVSVDDDPPAKVLAFTREQDMNYPVVMSNPTLSKTYGGDLVLPTAFIIDTQGRVVQKHTGVYSRDLYDQEIRALLGMPIEARIETFEDVGQVMLKNVAKATSLPGVPLDGLTDAQKKEVLHRLNAEKCTCGCDLTLAQCRVNDEGCPISLKLAAQVVENVREGKPASADPAKPDTSNP